MDTVQSAQVIIDNLGFDFSQFTMQKFVEWVEKAKGRRIFLFSIPMPSSTDGAWISDAERPNEYIFYDVKLSPILQVHTQLHEIGHILWGHETLKITSANLTQLIKAVQCQALSPGTSKLLMRALEGKKGQEEVEAEAVAHIIQSQVIRLSRMAALSLAVSNNNEVDKFLLDMGVS